MTTTTSAAATGEELLFHTGFEGTTRLAPARGPYFHGSPDQYEDFRGADTTLPAPSDWEKIAAHPVLGTLRLYYEGGTESQRYARIVPDEDDPANHVLRFWIGEPNVVLHDALGAHPKSRIQTELYGNTGLREFYQSVRLRLHEDVGLLKEYPLPFSWFTLAEFWNKPFWSEQGDSAPIPFPFRLSLTLRKVASGPVDALYFGSDSQMLLSETPFRVERVWDYTNTEYPIPIGSWMTVETYYREGNEETGRFFCAVTPDGGSRTVVLDIRNWTYHPRNPAPEGLTHYNPIKLYTSAEVVEFLRARGAALRIDWDDFALWAGKTPENRS